MPGFENFWSKQSQKIICNLMHLNYFALNMECFDKWMGKFPEKRLLFKMSRAFYEVTF